MKNNNLPLTIKETIDLVRSPTAKNTYLSFLGNGLFSLFTMICMIMVSRTLGPSQFGVFSVLFSFAVISFDVSALGLDQALVRFVSLNLSRGRQTRANQFVKAVFKIRLITALSLIFMGFFLSPVLSKIIFREPDYHWLLVFIFVSTANMLLVGGFFSSYLRARQEFLKDAIFQGIRGFFRAILIFLLFWLNKLSLMNAVLTFSFYHWPFLPLIFLFIPLSFLKSRPSKEIYKKLFSFSGWIYLWALTATLHSRLDIFMLERLRSSYETGIYAVATKPLTIFLTLINSFNLVLLPKISSITSMEHFSRFFKKLILALIGLVVLILVGIVVAEPLISLLFGSQYLPAVRILRILLLGIIFMGLNLPFMSTLTAWGKTQVIGLISTGQLILVALSNLFLIERFGGMGAAITYNLSNVFALLLSLIFYLRELKTRRVSYER